MEVEIISKDAIKPSKPTPSPCKSHTLSSLDQLLPNIYVPILLFYQAPSTPHKPVTLSSRLKKSLSETLTYYYPFAGKIKDDTCIDCDDEGVLFLEARAKTNLVDILTKPELEALSMLFPDDLQWKSSRNSRVLAVQLSYFDCGGASIGICISHKIADACTISTFLNDWASQAQESGALISPLLKAASIFPPSNQLLVPELQLVKANIVTRRYVFHPAKISELKATIASSSKVLHNPTRVEVVTSLISKSIIQADKIRSIGLVKSYVLSQIVNIRPKMIPPLSKNSIGNIAWHFPVKIEENDDITLERLAIQMREGLVKFSEFARNIEGKEWSSMAAEAQNNANAQSMSVVYNFSSWCRFPLYQVDFGWGSPIWVSTAEFPYKNVIILMDSKDGEGIEVYITLDEEVMYILQGDEEFLKFASLNPSI